MKTILVTFVLGLWVGSLATILVLDNNRWIMVWITRLTHWVRSKLGNKRVP